MKFKAKSVCEDRFGCLSIVATASKVGAVAFYIKVMSCGIYKWTSPSGKSYIGQSVNLENRKQDFITNKLYTTKNKRSLTVIDKARKKYPDFEQWYYEILEFCEPNELNYREQYYIKLFDTFKNGYNETSGGGQNTEISDETKEKLRQANIGKNKGKTPWNKGKTHSDETKEKMRQTHLGKTFSDETKEKLRQAHLGKTHSDEAKEKMRQGHLGKTLSDEHKEKIGKGHLGKTLSDETKEKIGKAHFGKTTWIKGKTHSDETKEKMRKAKHSKQVDQYSLDDVFIQSFVSLSDIEKQLGYSIGNISECCNGKRKTASGFIWRYHN